MCKLKGRLKCVENVLLLLAVVFFVVGCQTIPKGWKTTTAPDILEAQTIIRHWIVQNQNTETYFQFLHLIDVGATEYLNTNVPGTKSDRLLYASKKILSERRKNCPKLNIILDNRFSESVFCLAMIREGLTKGK